ncbi:unnamed protein product, partial [Notodromas monacha]
MKKVFRQKTKRVPTNRRCKVEKKVRDHKRKVKRLSKKNTNKPWVSKKKDVIPGACPFKEQILQELTEQKERVQEETKKRWVEIEAKQAANEDPIDMEVNDPTLPKEQQSVFNLERDGDNLDIPKSYSREFYKVVQDADVILEVLDARDPLGCRSDLIENAVKNAGSRKKLVLLLNKADLVPKQNLTAWLRYLRKDYPTVAFKSSTSQNRTFRSRAQIHKASSGLLQSSKCLGADSLLHLLANYCRSGDVKTSILVGVVGYPNVGKSSVINSLKRKRACKVGAVAGMTTSVQTVQLDKHIKLLDCPGLVLASAVAKGTDGAEDDASVEALLALRNCVRVETLENPLAPVDAIIKRLGAEQLMTHYKIPKFETTDELLVLLAKRFGQLKRGGIVDTDQAARMLINNWNSGKIKYWTEPPELPQNTHVTEGTQILSQLGESFNLDAEVLAGTGAIKPSSTIAVPTVKFLAAEKVDCDDLAMTETREHKPKSAGTDLSKVRSVTTRDELELCDPFVRCLWGTGVAVRSVRRPDCPAGQSRLVRTVRSDIPATVRTVRAP